jgi:hypothetical protein
MISNDQTYPGWQAAVYHALPILALILAAMGYWFGIADRYIIFLYHHNMGPGFDTSPFGWVTASRYWMAGLVADGMIMVLYTGVCWLLGRLLPGYRPPSWWRVWVICAGPLLVVLLLITMMVNQPTLPASNAAQVALATLIGLALALWPGGRAAARPRELAWLAADGWGMMLVLLFGGMAEDVGRWLAMGAVGRVRLIFGGFGAGVVWLLIVTALRGWRKAPIPGTGDVLASGLSITYLLMPLIHHGLGTDGIFYITDSSNFFADAPLFQLGVWVIAALVALGITRLRRALVRQPPTYKVAAN